jgi:GNAT superfamily N-acetyltransferase
MAVKILTYNNALQVEPFVKSIIDIYRVAFGQAPYFKNEAEVRAFTAIFPRHMLRPGFRCVVACEEETRAILGFAYGYTGAAKQWWHDLVVQKMTPEEAEDWMTDVFEVVELAVYPAAHGHGYGGRIHDALLQGLPHRTAVLSTYQVETNAMKMYEKRGWVTLLSDFIFPGYSEPYKIMGKLL